MTTHIYFPPKGAKGTISLAGFRINETGIMFSNPPDKLETLFKAGMCRRHVDENLTIRGQQYSNKTYEQWTGKPTDVIGNVVSKQKVYVKEDLPNDPYDKFKDTLSTKEDLGTSPEENVSTELTITYLRSLEINELKSVLKEAGLDVSKMRSIDNIIAKAVDEGIAVR